MNKALIITLSLFFGSFLAHAQSYTGSMTANIDQTEHGFLKISEPDSEGSFYVVRSTYNISKGDLILEKYSQNSLSKSKNVNFSRESSNGHLLTWVNGIYGIENKVIIVGGNKHDNKASCLALVLDKNSLEFMEVITLAEQPLQGDHEHNPYLKSLFNSEIGMIGIYLNSGWGVGIDRKVEYVSFGLDLKERFRQLVTLPPNSDLVTLSNTHMDEMGMPIWIYRVSSEKPSDTQLDDQKLHIYRVDKSSARQLAKTVISVDGHEITDFNFLYSTRGLLLTGSYSNYYWGGQGKEKSGARSSGVFYSNLDSGIEGTIHPTIVAYTSSDYSQVERDIEKLNKKLQKNWYYSLAQLNLLESTILDNGDIMIMSESRWTEDGGTEMYAGPIVISLLDSSGAKKWTSCIEKRQESESRLYPGCGATTVVGESSIQIFYNENIQNLSPTIVPAVESRKQLKTARIGTSTIASVELSRADGTYSYSNMTGGPGEGWLLRNDFTYVSTGKEQAIVFAESQKEECFLILNVQK